MAVIITAGTQKCPTSTQSLTQTFSQISEDKLFEKFSLSIQILKVKSKQFVGNIKKFIALDLANCLNRIMTLIHLEIIAYFY